LRDDRPRHDLVWGRFEYLSQRRSFPAFETNLVPSQPISAEKSCSVPGEARRDKCGLDRTYSLLVYYRHGCTWTKKRNGWVHDAAHTPRRTPKLW